MEKALDPVNSVVRFVGDFRSTPVLKIALPSSPLPNTSGLFIEHPSTVDTWLFIRRCSQLWVALEDGDGVAVAYASE